jgi:hypothetical protein
MDEMSLTKLPVSAYESPKLNMAGNKGLVGGWMASAAPWSRHGMVSTTRSTAAMEILMAAAKVFGTRVRIMLDVTSSSASYI